MKPVSLQMEAFGPYGAKTVIDFEPLADVGLFVVSGPTGAGKSTIFDAICFALYGSLSGARQSHVDVRSHYADPAAECQVELVFDANGDRWRVNRQPAQIRQKRRGSGTTERPADAVLERWVDGRWIPDAAKVRDVNARCRHLVGLSLDQFERVVLLPQGKFAEVLNARTSDRADLLRTLFGSEVFARVGDMLAEEAKAGERALQGAAEQRDRFRRRALDALDRADAEIAALPAEIAASVEAAAVERKRSARGAVVATTETTADSADGRHDGDRPSGAQLSLLDALPIGAVEEPIEGSPDATGSCDRGELVDDPVQRLSSLQSGPLVDLESVVASLHDAAGAARSDLERAEAQARAIEQRRAALEERRRLDDQSPAMETLAIRLETARRVAGLSSAVARRQDLSSLVDRHRTDIDEQWRHVRSQVESGIVGADADPVDGEPSPDLLGALLERTASRSSKIETLLAEQAVLDQQRVEHASLQQRIDDVDTELSDCGAELAALETERTSLEAEVRSLEPAVADKQRIEAEHDAISARVAVRRRADAIIERVADLDRSLAEQADAAAAARSAINGALEEMTLLDAQIERRPDCQAAVQSAERRLARHADIERATAELGDLDLEVSTLQTRADEAFAAFVRGAAPRLAAELADGSACPVCGSCEHPAPAVSTERDQLGGAVVDVAMVEAAAAAAARARARHGECRARLAALVADDADLVAVDHRQLDTELAEARAGLASVDQADAARSELARAKHELQQGLDTISRSTSATEAERVEAKELVASLLGELGAARDQTLEQVETTEAELRSRRSEADTAHHRLQVISSRLAAVVSERQELEGRRETLRIEQATGKERLGHLATSIREAESQRDDTVAGADLHTIHQQLVDLRERLLLLQQLTTEMAASEASFAVAAAACSELVADSGFDSERAALAAAMSESELESGEARHRDWVHRRTALTAAVEALDAQGLPEQGPDIDALRQVAISSETRRRSAVESHTSIVQHAHQAAGDLDEVGSIDTATAEQRAHHDVVRRVANVVRGNNSRRLSLENWVLSVYLQDVVEHANIHLHTMSNGRYRLLVQDTPSNQVGQHGLDLAIDDAHTGRVRPSISLSGGETFQASLALALGLADVVMVGRAGLHLDALFVDEGFGSLDADAVDQAITVLDGLRSRGSMVGVITHVEALKSALPVAIEVLPRSDQRGSEIRQVA